MKSLLHPVALLALCLVACGGATRDELFVAATGDEPASNVSPGAQGDEPAAPAPAVVAPVETKSVEPAAPVVEPVWRTCQTDDDCELRSSVCMPLEPGSSVTYCRQPLGALGAPCGASYSPAVQDQPAPNDDCEVGLSCAWAGIEHSSARVCALVCPVNDYGCERVRRPLVCGSQVPSALDARCEVE